MKKFGIILNENFEVSWIDRACVDVFGTNSCELLSRSVQDLFVNDNNFTDLIRWCLSSQDNHLNTSLIPKNMQEKVIVSASSLGLHILLTIKLGHSSGKRAGGFLKKKFWEVFSITFPGGILFLDENSHILEVSQNLLKVINPKTKHNISYSKNTFLKRPLPFLFQKGDVVFLDELQNKIKRSIFTREGNSFEGKVNNTYVRVFLGPVFEGKLYIGCCIYFFDVSEELQKNTTIENQRVLLFHSSKLSALGEMAGGVAHEINNPLAIISFTTSILKKLVILGKTDSKEFANALINIDKTIERITKIITGLKKVSRDTTNEDFEHCKVEDFLNDTLSMCLEKFKIYNVEFNLEISASDKSQMIKILQVQLSQVIINLLNNAFDAISTFPKKWIKLIVKIEHNKIIFKVLDCGGGIAKEIRDKMFQPFFTTKGVGKGTGIGLSLSNSIINLHEGSLYVDDKNENTCFVVSLPLK